MSDKAVVVLAAGKGKRMKSDLPKVLHPLNGQPMITRLLDTLVPLDFKHIIVVIGHQGELVQKELHGLPVEFTWQDIPEVPLQKAVWMIRINGNI